MFYQSFLKKFFKVLCFVKIIVYYKYLVSFQLFFSVLMNKVGIFLIYIIFLIKELKYKENDFEFLIKGNEAVIFL